MHARACLCVRVSFLSQDLDIDLCLLGIVMEMFRSRQGDRIFLAATVNRQVPDTCTRTQSEAESHPHAHSKPDRDCSNHVALESPIRHR